MQTSLVVGSAIQNSVAMHLRVKRQINIPLQGHKQLGDYGGHETNSKPDLQLECAIVTS